MSANWSTVPVVSKTTSKPATNNNKPKKQQSSAASIPGTPEYAAAQAAKPKNNKKKVSPTTEKELSQKEIDILAQNSMGYDPKPTKVSQAVTGTSGRQTHRGAKS